jgi:hypothetical protein
MKYLLVAVLGVLVGAAGAVAVVYFNPLSETVAALPETSDRVYRYSLPDHVLAFALGEDARPFGEPGSEGPLWEETVDRTAAVGLVLNDGNNQPAAIASRLIAVSPDTDLLLRGVLLNDYWLVTAPGEGTLFVQADANAWPFVKETLLPVYLDRAWTGPAEYSPTVGPAADRAGLVLGTAGTLQGEGRAVERLTLTAFDKGRAAAATGELHLDLPEPQVAVQQ